MSLRQHCDVVGCDAEKEIPLGQPDTIPDGWHCLFGLKTEKPVLPIETTSGTAVGSVTVTERHSVVICDRHALPWEVRVGVEPVK